MLRFCSTDSLLVVLVVAFLFLFGSCSEFGSSTNMKDDPCRNYTAVTGPWRNVGFPTHNFHGWPLCDNHLAGKWARFTGVGGDTLTDKCFHALYCGSQQCARLLGSHPNLGDGIVAATLRTEFGAHCHYQVGLGKVKACPGEFFVYLLSAFNCPANYAVHHRNCSVADCGPLAECVTDGACRCIAGYRLRNKYLPVNESYDCVDIDECASGRGLCDKKSDCVNTPGSYNCSCHQGYQTPNNTMPSPSNPCKDTNECEEEPDICGPNADCSNTKGAHLCPCHPGYHVLPEGSVANISNPCQDIDECLEDICGPNSTCTNTIGNYTCACVTGYSETSEGFVISASNPCIDTDECLLDPPICGPNANCTNSVGAYICDCHLGYQNILSASISEDPCEDVDECLTAECGPGASCYNTPGSYYCSCKEGYIGSTGFTWQYGVTVCTSVNDKIASITPPEGQTAEVAFLNGMNQDLADNPDLILPPGTVTSIISTVLLITDDMSPEEGPGSGDVANIVLDVSEKLASALIEPTSTETRKLVTTPNMEINLQIIGPAWNVTKIPALNAKGNTMTVDSLAALAENNNGSASAVLMAVNGMEKLMSPSFYESENVTEMYSDIITATLPKTKYRELPEPVNFTVPHKKMFQAGMVTCVYWKERGEETHWSEEGCTASFSNETHTVCSCTHLSTFAILLQTQKQEEDDSLLEVVNVFCMCVGLTFLALAILTFLLCPWNPKINNTARLHLSICLFLGHLLFLVGVSRTENAVVCAVIAGILHFIFLSSFVWMLLETLQLYLLVRSLSKVQIIQKEGLKALYLLLIGYGIPMVVVGVSAAVFSDGYGSKDTCWLSHDQSFNWSFIGPVCCIISVNWISFCFVLWSLRPTLASMKSDVSQSRDTRLIIFKIVAQFLVLGCTWILGFFQSTSFLKYLFIILNSQQGTFIFIVHCLLNKEVREVYKRWFSCVLRKKEPSGSKQTPNIVSTVHK